MRLRCTYIFFRLGPGFPLCFGVVAPLAPSIAAAFRFVPGLGPFLLGPAAGGASDDGVLVPFMLGVESAGVSAGVGSMLICGAGVSDGGDSGFADGAGVAAGSWGNLISTSGESLSVMLSDFGFAVIFATERDDEVVFALMSAAGGGSLQRMRLLSWIVGWVPL
jgi:hypothetical protein